MFLLQAGKAKRLKEYSNLLTSACDLQIRSLSIELPVCNRVLAILFFCYHSLLDIFFGEFNLRFISTVENNYRNCVLQGKNVAFYFQEIITGTSIKKLST